MLLLSLTLVAGCASTSGTGATIADTDAASDAGGDGHGFATLGEVLSEERDEMSATIADGVYTCVFRDGDTWVQVRAALPADVAEEAQGAWSAGARDLVDILGDVAVWEVRECEALGDAELASLVGMTGAELEEAGFVFAGDVTGRGDGTVSALATLDDVSYQVRFSGDVADGSQPLSRSVARLVASDVTVYGAYLPV